MALGRVTWRAAEVRGLTRKSVSAGLTRAAIVLQTEMIDNMGSQGNPSSPGEFPGIRTGNLRRSLSIKAATVKDLRAAAGTKLGQANYALWLEFGTSRMAARPWAMRSLRRAERRMRTAFKAAAGAEFKAGAAAKGGRK